MNRNGTIPIMDIPHSPMEGKDLTKKINIAAARIKGLRNIKILRPTLKVCLKPNDIAHIYLKFCVKEYWLLPYPFARKLFFANNIGTLTVSARNCLYFFSMSEPG